MAKGMSKPTASGRVYTAVCCCQIFATAWKLLLQGDYAALAVQTSKTSETLNERDTNMEKKGWRKNQPEGYFCPESCEPIPMPAFRSYVCTDMASCLLSIRPRQAETTPPPRPPPPHVRVRALGWAPCQIHQIVSATAASRRPAPSTMEATH